MTVKKLRGPDGAELTNTDGMSEISGYTVDYLRVLTRGNLIPFVRIGKRNWYDANKVMGILTLGTHNASRKPAKSTRQVTKQIDADLLAGL